jgi:glutathione synthase/RimK-type ligase-like ATP-grasp enzyme
VDANLNVENLDLNKLADNQELLKVAISAPESFEYKDFSKLALPMVVKAKFGFGKKQVSLCNNQEQLEKFALNYKDGEVLVQKFVPAEFEYKVITVGYKSISKVIKFKTWAGGFGIDPQDCQILDSKNCPEVCHLAEAAAKVLGKELAKTDILESAGKLYVVEVNRSPGFESFEKLSGENVAAEFVAYLKQNFTK